MGYCKNKALVENVIVVCIYDKELKYDGVTICLLMGYEPFEHDGGLDDLDMGSANIKWTMNSNQKELGPTILSRLRMSMVSGGPTLHLSEA